MAIEPIFQQVAVEIRYLRGMVYLDRCGGLYVRMSDELGPAFTPSLPTIEATNFVSSEERLSIRLGPANLLVAQTWTNSPARVEQIATKAWGTVLEVLDVKSQVFRAGMRFMMQWGVKSAEEAHNAVLKIAPSSGAWNAMFGSGTPQTYVTVQPASPDKASTRVELTMAQNHFKELTPALKGKVSPIAVQLDIDYVLPGAVDPFDAVQGNKKTQALTVDSLRLFLRTSSEAMNVTASEFSKAAGL